MSAETTDFERLLDVVVPFAIQSLAKHGEFYPFGASAKTDGETAASSTYDGNERPNSKDVENLILEAFRNEVKAGKIRAVAVCTNITVVVPDTDKATDAISVRLESRAGEPLAAIYPYQKGWFGRINYGKPFSTKVPGEIFSKALNAK